MSAGFSPGHRAESHDAVVFFDHAREMFERAQAMTSPHEVDLSIAGYRVRLRFAGEALREHALRALGHHAAAGESAAERGQPDLTICLWDGASTAESLPTLPFDLSMVTRRGEVAAYQNERIQLTFSRFSDTLSLLDVERNVALFCTRDARRIPNYETAAPLKTILYWWLRTRQVYFVHAGAVGNETGAVLLAGKGGAGKSTSALACLAAGMRYVSDDYCLVAPNPVPYVYNLYNSGKVTANSLRLLPQLREAAAESDLRADDKTILFLDRTHGRQLADGLPLKAVVLPRVTGRAEPRLVRTTGTAALSALAISTMVQLANAGMETLRPLEGLTNALPCFVLELGQAERVPQVIEALLNELR